MSPIKAVFLGLRFAFLNGRINSMINSADEDDSVRGKSQQCKRDRANTQMNAFERATELGI